VKRVLVFFVSVAAITAAYSEYAQVKSKFDKIAKDRLRPGSRVSITPQELNAYVQAELKEAVPEGVREPKVQLGSGRATGTALVDFEKVRRAQGNPPGWFLSKLLAGERPVTVTARIESGDGRARVDVERVEISGLPVEGRVLDWLVDHYVRSRYPAAKIGEPFALGHRMERLEVNPGGVDVHIAR
jgi:hypothetical protein